MRKLLFLATALIGLTVGATTLSKPSTWSEGIPAEGMPQLLIDIQPMKITLPASYAEHITTDTAVFYYSPTCPHCQAVIPEVNALAAKHDLPWIGVAVGSSSPEMIESFRREFKVSFPMIWDEQAEFAMAMGARATPNVYIIGPMKEKDSSSVEVVPSEENGDSKTFLLKEIYAPYAMGYGPLLMLRYAKMTDQDPFTYFEGYQGTRACSACHTQEGKSWAITHHAQAYYTLYKKERTDDPECVSCHVVGLGTESGFVLGEHNSPMTDVGCESCHTASGPHDGVYEPASNSCLGCHNAEHSIHFSTEKGLPLIDHYMANKMSDRELEKRMQEIANGEASRPLLAFDQKETVGVSVCQDCHTDIHPSDPHANAMKTLTRKERKKGDCVSCHSTQKIMGPKTKNISDYRVEESVGCESCHGAGVDHAQNPTKDNIVGLGESCPECVLEALCTSCHTQKWDPEWDLHTRLEFYRSSKHSPTNLEEKTTSEEQ
jgi:thiol-disulfide isomerase/thioredoxin